MNSALAILSSKNIHFGFILFAGGLDSGDCVFSLVPTSSQGFDDPEFKFLECYGFRVAGEHLWEMKEGKIELKLTSGEIALIDLHLEKLMFSDKKTYRIQKTKVD
jgi:hypothetical protein